MNLRVLFAQADLPLPGFAPMSPAMRERLLVLGAMAVVVVGVLFWVLVIRMKPPPRPGQPRRRHSKRSVVKSAKAGLDAIKWVIRSRQRPPSTARRRRHPARTDTHRPLSRQPDVKTEVPGSKIEVSSKKPDT